MMWIWDSARAAGAADIAADGHKSRLLWPNNMFSTPAPASKLPAGKGLPHCWLPPVLSFLTRAHGRRKFADFEVKKIVGEGHKSSVAWAKDRHSGLDVAIKMYHSSKMSILNCRQASSLCKSLCGHGAGWTQGVATSKSSVSCLPDWEAKRCCCACEHNHEHNCRQAA